MTSSHRSFAALLLLGICAPLAACSRSCKEDRPFVPYSIDPSFRPIASPSGSHAAASHSAPSATASAAGSFSPIQAERAPSHSARVTIDGATLLAPSGREFRWLLKGDYDDDGHADMAAWVQSPDGTSGELIVFAKREAGSSPSPVTCTSLPASFLRDADCPVDTDLSLIGQHTVLLSARRSCADASAAARPPHWHAVVMPARLPALRLEVLVEPSSSGQDVTLKAEAVDRDGDRWDDVTITLTAAGEPALDGPPNGAGIDAQLRYFDRPAGLSRDPHEPEESLRGQVAKLARLARKKGTWREVAMTARRLRGLAQLVCAESGLSVLTVQGGALSCAATSALQDLDMAELDAALHSNEIVTALGLLARAEHRSATFDPRKLSDARARLQRAVLVRQAEAFPVAGPSVPSAPRGPSWGALAFESDGSLLVRGATSMVRIDPKSKTVTPLADTEAASKSWPIAITAPDSTLSLTAVLDPCDGNPPRVERTPTDPSGGPAKPIPLPIDTLLARNCARVGTSQPSDIRVLAGTTAGIEALVDGIPVALFFGSGTARTSSILSPQPAPPGSPRSPNGRFAALPSSIGIVVFGPDNKVEVWRTPPLAAHYATLLDCTVANNATVAACMDGATPTLLIPAGSPLSP